MFYQAKDVWFERHYTLKQLKQLKHLRGLMQIITLSRKGRKKQGKRICYAKRVKKVTDPLMKKKLYKKKIRTITLFKNVPRGCSRPKQMCIECFKQGKTTYIHKNDSNYEMKVCKDCFLDYLFLSP